MVLTDGAHPWCALATLLAVTLSLLIPTEASSQTAVPQQALDPQLRNRLNELEEAVRRLQAQRGQQVQPAEAKDAHPVQIEQSSPAEVIGGERVTETLDREGGGTRAKNLTDELGLISRGVFETSVPRRVIGAGQTAGWDDGFFLRNLDGSNWIRFGADVQFDYREFPDDRDTKDVDSFLVRKARLSTDGILATYYDFRIMVDFSNGQSATSTIAAPRILDAYGNVHYWDAFQLQLGKYKQPFSFEQLILDRHNPFIERSLFDQRVPAREPGAMVHGEYLWSDRLDYAFSISNGEINADYDVNESKDLVGRVLFRPFNGSWYVDCLKRLQFGIDATVGIENESVNGLTLRTPATIPWFTFNNLASVGGSSAISNAVFANGRRTRVAPEIAYFYGGLGMAAQYYREQQLLQESASGPGSQITVNLPMTGFVVLGTLLLTGEERTAYTQAIEPRRPFNPFELQHGYGAWELSGRVSRLELGDDAFTPFAVRSGTTQRTVQLADPTKFSSGVTEMTLGCNWYLNRFVKVQFNYEHDWFDQPVSLGTTAANRVRSGDALLTRLQFNY